MAKTGNPFADYDFTKAFGEFKLPGFDIEALVAAQQRNLEAITSANKLAIEGFQAAAMRQAEIVRETMEHSAEAAQEYVKMTRPEEKMASQAKYAKAAYQTGLDTMREITGIVGQATTEAVDVMTKRFAEGLDEFEGLVVNGAKAPKAEAAPKPPTK